MTTDFQKNTSIIKYNIGAYSKDSNINEDIIFTNNKDENTWLNTYGNQYGKEFLKIIKHNKLDDFLVKLLMEDYHPNKVIELDGLLFIAIRILKTEDNILDSEQMLFICSPSFVWSIQEKHGDYFDWIRERLENNKGISRKKNADYLLFLILESIIDNYQEIYETKSNLSEFEVNKVRPTPEFTELVENRKQMLYKFKKAASSLRDIIIKLEKTEMENLQIKYFSELKEQSHNLISEIDFEIHELESKLNLIFSIQGHRLNEVMKTLTIFSVIFIPLTFIAGIYGMNFKNMPELDTQNGYFILIGAMLLISIVSVLIIRKKKWF